MAFELQKRCLSYYEPIVLLLYAAYGALLAIYELALRRDLQGLVSLSQVKDLSFARLWLLVGPMFAEGEEETAVPSLVSTVYGTVLELGPGGGTQTRRMDASKITKVYGIEPTIALHNAIRDSAKAAGLNDVYEILPCGIEDQAALKQHGILEGTFDTILSVQVLCSVPHPEETARQMYKLLKPGGQLIIYEHLRNEDFISSKVQKVYNPIWSLAVGNCHLDRPTDQYLFDAGDWARVELKNDMEESKWSLFPRTWGRLIKPKVLGG